MRLRIVRSLLSSLCLCACLLCPALQPLAQQAEAKRTVVRVPPARSTASAIAEFLTSQPPNTRWQVNAPTVPPLAAIAKLLPAGTVVKGNELILPNGTNAIIVKNGQVQRPQSPFAARTYTRGQVVMLLRLLPPATTVKVRQPNQKQFSKLGNRDEAVKVARKLPVGTEILATLPNGSIAHYQMLKP